MYPVRLVLVAKAKAEPLGQQEPPPQLRRCGMCMWTDRQVVLVQAVSAPEVLAAMQVLL